MKWKIPVLFSSLLIVLPSATTAGLITAIPGPDDQGGMIMPMISIEASNGSGNNPTSGTINIMYSPEDTPVLQSLQDWTPGDWFAESAAWRTDLGSPKGIGGTPTANAGNGSLFNNQYGFMFMSMGSMGMANIPENKSLGIRLDSLSSPELLSYNYVNSTNLWDAVFEEVDDQVLWSGSMWHNYFILPPNASPGTYTATFEIFIADLEFSGTTGFAQYDEAARSAAKDTNFQTAFVEYYFTVIPEPAHFVFLLALAVLALTFIRGRG